MQGIRKEQLLAADLVIGNGALPLRRDQPINEGLAFFRSDMGCFAGLTRITPY
jgi:hypothetical protein